MLIMSSIESCTCINFFMSYMCIPWLNDHCMLHLYIYSSNEYPFVHGLFTLFTHIVSLDELYHITDGYVKVVKLMHLCLLLSIMMM